MPPPKWTFASRFRRNAFGWRSSLPIQRLKEAVSEIRSVARTDRALAADGAVLLLEKLSPALEQVDSSSGALGSAVNRTIDALVPVIVAADVTLAVRGRWLDRLFEALQDDQMPYIEPLGDHWGALCVTPELVSEWADRLLPLVTLRIPRKKTGDSTRRRPLIPREDDQVAHSDAGLNCFYADSCLSVKLFRRLRIDSPASVSRCAL